MTPVRGSSTSRAPIVTSPSGTPCRFTHMPFAPRASITERGGQRQGIPMNFLAKLFDNNERDVTKYRKTAGQINALEAEYQKLTDAELRGKTDVFKERFEASITKQGGYETLREQEREAIASGNSQNKHVYRDAINKALDELLVEAFAACREAGRRSLGMRHYDVQLIGGMVQHDGRISELRTGEGKTLMCTLAIYLNALSGLGVHVVTANDYLVKRDAVWMGTLYHALGLSVGILQGTSPETGEGGGTFLFDPAYEDPSEDGLDARFRYSRQTSRRADAYECDITYGTSSEFGFDYLRDNMVPDPSYLTQVRGHNFGVVDECDSNLIDEARTPLIISGQSDKGSDLYYSMDKLIPILERGATKKDKYDETTDEKDYTVDEKAKNASLTENGITKIEQALGVEDLSAVENLEYMQHAVAALKAHAVFEKDKDYVVRANKEGKPEVVIVDENTGRLMFGRRWSDGLHQAVEAKEGIEVENESQTMATITIQNYFRLYRKLAGMTGTAKTEEDEFRKIYALDVVQVPTNKPIQRKDLADTIYKTEDAKFRGIAMELLSVHCTGQPILVGTRSIDTSERVSARLTAPALEVLGAVLLIRDDLEAKAKTLGDKYGEYTAYLNQPMEKLSMANLYKIAKELSVELSYFDGEARKPAFDALAKRLEISGAEALQRFEEALRYGIPHNVLNAKFHEQEARIIAEAGRQGAVTIATNMAGRGVDILLGGTHYKDIEGLEGEPVKEIDTSYRRGGKYGRIAEAHVVGARDTADAPELLGPAGAGTIAIESDTEPPDIAREREAVKTVGGLYILGTERHESRRIDNQLRGRAGRQGDPGASHFNVSLEDYLWRVFGDRNKGFLMDQWRDDEAVQMPFLAKLIENAQKKVEAHNFDARKHVLEYDDIMNVQREVIYRERRKILEGTDLRETILGYLHASIDEAAALYLSDTVPADEWDRAGLVENLGQLFPLMNYLSAEDIAELDKDAVLERLHETAETAYADKEEEIGEENMRDFERRVAQRVLDQSWVAHLSDMDYLREGIGLRGYGQTDPLVAYKKEALELFEQMQGGIQGDIARQLFMSSANTGDSDVYQMFGGGNGDTIDEDTLRQIIAQMTAQAGLTDEDGNAIEGYDGTDPAMAIPGFAPVGRPHPVPAGAMQGQPMQMPPEVGSLLAAVANAQQERADAVDFSNALPDEPCPCGSGKPFKRCHRNR